MEAAGFVQMIWSQLMVEVVRIYLILVEGLQMDKHVFNTAEILQPVCWKTLTIYIYMICIIIDDRDHDRPILDDQSQFVVWAYGPRAVEEGLQDLALFHTEWPRNGGELHFSLHFDCMHVTSCMQLLFQKM